MAVVQSLTEFLPISSTAHLAIIPQLMGWTNPQLNSLDFDIALHLGTLAAVVLYFAKDWIRITAEGFGIHYSRDHQISRNPRLFWMLVLGTIPVGVFGLVLKKYAEGPWRTFPVMGVSLVVIGVVMWVADRVTWSKKTIGDISFKDAMIIGLSQALAIVPGVSRSGITISTGLMRNLERPSAARFSFLLSTPALAAAALGAFMDLRKAGGLSPDMVTAFTTGIIVSAITGIVVIHYFMRFLRTHTLRFFVYYRIVFGIIIIALAIFARR